MYGGVTGKAGDRLPMSISAAAITSNEKEGARVVPFDTPLGCHLARLSLAYRREPGTTRIEGSIMLQQVRVRRVG